MHDPEDWGAARNVVHLEATLNEERRKFQQETLRTYELIVMLQRWMKRARDQGCRTDADSPKACDTCRLMVDTKELLVRPLGALTADARAEPVCGNDAEKVAEIATESVAPIPEKEPSEDGSVLRAKGMETPTPA